MLGFWILSGIILPKATANLGASLYPTTTKAQMDAEVHEQAQHGSTVTTRRTSGPLP
ncbi:hypothetical protein [Hymenobacter sp. AT01-02]|uniref:hypothetical protein n=1 Tax=Hymenobacter sp. AT01-02 TaxID=1571877 RepID=UPI000A91BD7B|nr:hypothetical protein [Hymenobacter sp. AT01-02]